MGLLSKKRRSVSYFFSVSLQFFLLAFFLLAFFLWMVFALESHANVIREDEQAREQEKTKNSKENLWGVFEEWKAKTKRSRPDQIRIDPKNRNIIWFTQPAAHGITRFDYLKKKIKEYKTKKKYRPDGLVIDSEGVLWFGEQGSGTLGSFDPKTKKFQHHLAPYKDAFPAIPNLDQNGKIWVSDHRREQILFFDPKTLESRSLKLPTAPCFPVETKTDQNNRIWYTCYHSDRLGVIKVNEKQIIEYNLPERQLGPAFMAVDSQNRIWFVLWKNNGIALFDPKTKILTRYDFPISNVGPAALTIDSKDRLYFSTKQLNSIVLFEPAKPDYFYSFTIPRKKSGQKDGIAVDTEGIIWFTEFDANRFGRLELFYEPPKKRKKRSTLQEVKKYATQKKSYRPLKENVYLLNWSE